MRARYVWIILRKELTEIGRNRLALAGIFALPFLLYPLLMVSVGKFAKSQVESQEKVKSSVAVWGDMPSSLAEWLRKDTTIELQPSWANAPGNVLADWRDGFLKPDRDTEDLRAAAGEVLSAKKTDVVLVLWPGSVAALDESSVATATIFSDSVWPNSDAARERLRDALVAYRQEQASLREKEKSLPAGFSRVLEIRTENTASEERKSGDNWGKSLPILLFSTCVAAMLIMAIDLTAGEKDRATLQTLLCAPLRSIEIVTAKFLAVWAVGLTASLANGLSMCAAISFLGVNNPAMGLSVGKIALGTVLLLPATALFAAGALAVGASSRDSKDAGQFAGATFSFTILPMAASGMPGLELNPWTCLVPLANLSLLIKAIFTGEAALDLALLAIGASLLYAVLTLFLAARAFAKETVLVSDKNEIVSLFRVERSADGLPTAALGVFLYAVIMAATFYGSLAMARVSVTAMLVVVQYGCILLPTLLAVGALRLSPRETFSLRSLSPRNAFASVVIGLFGSIAVMNLVLRWLTPPDELAESMKKIVTLGDATPSLLKMLLLAAVTPAICEELFFRGLMTAGLRRIPTRARIALVAFLFAFLHGSIYRIAPTFSLGLVLGLVLHRCGSIFACMIVHAMNNGLAICLAVGVFGAGGDQLPEPLFSWWAPLASLVGLGLGLWMLRPMPRVPR